MSSSVNFQILGSNLNYVTNQSLNIGLTSTKNYALTYTPTNSTIGSGFLNAYLDGTLIYTLATNTLLLYYIPLRCNSTTQTTTSDNQYLTYYQFRTTSSLPNITTLSSLSLPTSQLTGLINVENLTNNLSASPSPGFINNTIISQNPGTTYSILKTINTFETGIWNGWSQNGFRATGNTVSDVYRMSLVPDRFALVSGVSGIRSSTYYQEFYFCNSLIAYLNVNGTAWVTLSDKNKKKNLREKIHSNDKSYLKRILKLPIYSYNWNMYETSPHQSNLLDVGPIYQDVEKIFNGNCIGTKKFSENYSCSEDCTDCKKHKDYYGDDNKHVNHQEIFYYHILAFKEYVIKTDAKIEKLENEKDDLIVQLNKLIIETLQSKNELMNEINNMKIVMKNLINVKK